MTESRDANKFMIRMPDGMRERIAASAKANNRSMNAEIVSALDAIYPALNYRGTIERIRDAIDETIMLGYPGGVESLRTAIFELAEAAKEEGVDVSDLIDGL